MLRVPHYTGSEQSDRAVQFFKMELASAAP